MVIRAYTRARIGEEKGSRLIHLSGFSSRFARHLPATNRAFASPTSNLQGVLVPQLVSQILRKDTECIVSALFQDSKFATFASLNGHDLGTIYRLDELRKGDL
jgi:hypothetical protein